MIVLLAHETVRAVIDVEQNGIEAAGRIGVGAAGTSLLVLLAKRVAPERRAPAAGGRKPANSVCLA